MKKIEIIFLENYSSFKKNEKISFNIESNLLILSGENGAGKSQLFKAIQKNSLKKQKQIYGQPQSNTQICRVEIDGVQIKNKEIVLKKIGDIATIFNPPQSVELSSRKIIANSLLNAFKNDQAPVNYENSYDEFKNKANGHIFNKQEDVLDFLQDDDLSWFIPDDTFTASIHDLFINFIEKRSNDTNFVSKPNEEKDKLPWEKITENSPWNLLNNIFKKLNISYKYQDDYNIPKGWDSADINFDLVDIRTNEKRKLQDLSDGEKALISIALASIYKNKKQKLLLLDEYDSVLNPWLIDRLFLIIKEYYLDKNIVVMLATHNLGTIILSPEYADCYEIYKNHNTNPIRKNEFSEAKNEIEKIKHFYKMGWNHELIETITKKIESCSKKNILLVEDTYTEIYKASWLKLNGHEFSESNITEIFEKFSDMCILSLNGKNMLQSCIEKIKVQDKYICGLFDYDSAFNNFKSLKNSNPSEFTYDEENNFLTSIHMPNVSVAILPIPKERKDIASPNYKHSYLDIELLFSDDVLEKMGVKDKINLVGHITIPKIHNKNNFWKKILSLPKEDFANFDALFSYLKKIFNSMRKKNGDHELQ